MSLVIVYSEIIIVMAECVENLFIEESEIFDFSDFFSADFSLFFESSSEEEMASNTVKGKALVRITKIVFGNVFKVKIT